MERLDKLLSSTGRWSRKEAEQLIRSGRVTVDGVVAAGRRNTPTMPSSPWTGKPFPPGDIPISC